MDEGALEQFGTLQAVVKAIRNARAEYGVELGRKVAATVLIRGDEALRCGRGVRGLVLMVRRGGLGPGMQPGGLALRTRGAH